MAKKRDFLSKEATITKMAEIRAAIAAKVEKRNNTESATELAKLDEEIKKDVKEYNGYGHDLVLLEHLGSPDCIKELCTIRKYDTISTKTTKEESGFRRLSIEDSKSNIDLTKINDTKIKAPWFYKSELFALWVTGETCAELEIDGMIDQEKFFKDLTGFFKISEEAKKAAKESGSPSNRAVLEVLRGTVSAMIGEEQGAKVIMPHVRFIKCGLTSVRKNSETGTVRFAKIDEIIGLVTDVCHLILTNKKVQADISKSLSKTGKEWQKDGFKPTPEPIVQQKIEETPKSAAPESAPETPETPVSQKKSKASKESKAKAPRQRKAKTAATK